MTIRVYVSGDDCAPSILYEFHDEVTRLSFRGWNHTWEYQELRDFGQSRPRDISGARAAELIRQQLQHSTRRELTLSESARITRRNFKRARANN